VTRQRKSDIVLRDVPDHEVLGQIQGAVVGRADTVVDLGRRVEVLEEVVRHGVGSSGCVLGEGRVWALCKAPWGPRSGRFGL